MHAHQNSFAKCRYQSRALSASPTPPPIPPQPAFIQYKQSQPLSFDDAAAPASPPPPPPSRSYQLIPIHDSIINKRSSQPSPKMQSFVSPSFEQRSFNRNNYENIRGTVKPFVVKDPRRKPYYYNELNQSLDIELDEQNQNSNTKSNPTKSESLEHHLNDENQAISTIKGNQSATNYYGSGGSLDHIF